MHRPSLLSPPVFHAPLFCLLPYRQSFLCTPASFLLSPCTAIRPSCRRCVNVFTPVSAPRTGTGSGSLLAEAVLGSKEEEEDDEQEEEGKEIQENGLVEVGYISSVHGLKGGLRVIPSTDFPELRFAKPGKRWLRTRISGKQLISEVELTGGRGHPGQKSWIVSFDGIDTVDKAKQIVGSTVLVKVGDRPDLEEGEFYTLDLVGMRVFLKETGRLVGVVANVFNHGASDLLQVMLDSDENGQGWSNPPKPDINRTGQHVWIPFVETIVPDVNMDKREMWITPPKGLLELNLRSDMRSKKERRLLVRSGKKKGSYSRDLLLLKRGLLKWARDTF